MKTRVVGIRASRAHHQIRLLLATAAIGTVPLVLSSCVGKGGSDGPLDPTEPATCVFVAPDQALEPAPAESHRLRLAGLADSVSDGLASWFEGHGTRRMYVQLDRPLYRPGDDVWIKSWDLGTSQLSGEGSGKGVRYELIDPRGQSVAQKDVQHSVGKATNDLHIPSNAAGGAWTLRATTVDGHSLERVFIVDHYEPPRIRKELDFAREAYGPGDTVRAVVSLSGATGGALADVPVEAVVQVDGELVTRLQLRTDAGGEVLVSFALPDELKRADGLLTVLADAGGTTESISRSIPIIQASMDLAFYPEGGDLVEGLPSRVYVEATDPHGRPADVSGRIEDDLGEVVGRFTSVHDGLGRFELRPMPGRSYRAVVEEPAGIDAAVALPEIRTAGCVLRTYDDLEGELDAVRASVRCSDPREVVVAASVRESLIDVAAVRAGPQTLGTVYLSAGDPAVDGKQGVARITVFDTDLSPLAERVVYRNPGEDLQVELTPDKERYQPRDEVVLTVRTTTSTGEPVPAELAISVVDDTVLAHADDERGHILSRLYLESDLPAAEIDDPAWYYDDDEAQARRGLDLLMGTKGWRRFEWKQVFDYGEDAVLTEASDPAAVPTLAEAEEAREALAWRPEQRAVYWQETIRAQPAEVAVVHEPAPSASEAVAGGEVADLTGAAHEGQRRPATGQAEAPRMSSRTEIDFDGVELDAELVRPHGLAVERAVGSGSLIDGIEMPVRELVPDGSGRLGTFGISDLNADMAGGIGGLIGAKGTEVGAGGLASRGSGLGGGGSADGLQGLGTKGRGSGVSGYGVGGGSFGAKGAGGLSRIGGDPVILGALDKSLVDAVVKRHMNQIRYCYQRELTRSPDIEGKVTMKFVIDRDGRVSAADVKTSSLDSAAVEGCLEARFQRFRFPEPKGGGIAIVAYPFVFVNDGGVGQVAGASQSTTRTRVRYEDRWAPVRVFPKPLHRDDGVRSDFRDTVHWEPAVKTGEDGTAEVRFVLSDAVTTFRAVAEGLGSGVAGRGEVEVESVLPFHLDARLPDALSAGDRLLLPVTLTSTLSDAVGVLFEADIGQGVAVQGATAERLTLEAEGAETLVIPVVAGLEASTVGVTLRGEADGLTDALTRSFAVVPRGFDQSWTRSGELSTELTEVSYTVKIDELVDHTLSARLDLHPSPASLLVDGLEGMLRTPGGCFEQTSSANYPNVLVIETLRRQHLRPSQQVGAEKMLATGYQRLEGYQVSSGGFETWGKGPGKEALSAYGLRQFTAMKRVYEGVSKELLEEDRRYLLDARDGTGGYTKTGHSSHRYGMAPKDTLDAYITWALATTGTKGLDAELGNLDRLARTSDDPYVLALATSALAHTGRTTAATSAARRLRSHQATDGSFPGAESSIMRSGGNNLTVETTALATMALLEAGGHTSGVNAGAMWLMGARSGRGNWGATQATVLTLEALTKVSEAASRPKGWGKVHVAVDGEPAGSLSWKSTQLDGLSLTDLADHLGPGEHEITLSFEGRSEMPFTLSAEWRATTQPTDARAALTLETVLDKEAVAQGETVRLTTEVGNRHGAEVPSPIARIGLPAGLDAQVWQLEELVEKGQIAFFELRPREVTLYWDGLAATETHSVDLDLVASLPGTFAGPASSAWPYYDDTYRTWADELEIDVRR